MPTKRKYVATMDDLGNDIHRLQNKTMDFVKGNYCTHYDDIVKAVDGVERVYKALLAVQRSINDADRMFDEFFHVGEQVAEWK